MISSTRSLRAIAVIPRAIRAPPNGESVIDIVHGMYHTDGGLCCLMNVGNEMLIEKNS